MSETEGFQHHVHFWEADEEEVRNNDDSDVTEPSFKFIFRSMKMIVVGNRVVSATVTGTTSHIVKRKGLRYGHYMLHILGQLRGNVIRQQFVDMVSAARAFVNDDRHLIPFVFCVHEYERAEELEARAFVESMEESAVQMVGAAKESVDSLESVVLGADESADSCVVCMEELGTVAKVMPCGHYFHGDCIKKWLGTSHVCPLCRFPMPTSTL